MKKIILSIIISTLFATAIFSQEITNYSKDQIDQKLLSSIISNDYEISAYEDGDLKVSYDGINILLTHDTERAFLKFRTYWLASDDITPNKAFRIVNSWNVDKIFAVAAYEAYSDRHIFSLEYFITTIGGINEQNLNETFDWIFSIANGFASYLSDNDALTIVSPSN